MNIALVLSGGTGTRMGVSMPKQYIEVNGRIIISYCLEQLLVHDQIDAIQIVADKAWHEVIMDAADKICKRLGNTALFKKCKGFSSPGANRQLSILNGLEDIREYAKETDCVLIHDAARPLLTVEHITDCINAVRGHDGVIPVLKMKDTVYLSRDGLTITSLLDRSQIYAGQAPEMFRLGVYYEANKRLLPDKILHINGSTEPAVMAGLDIVMIPGDEENIKITTRSDLERFERRMKVENESMDFTGNR